MRKRQKQSFSLIPLPPSYSPVIPPPPSYLSFKILSSSLIAVAAAMRDYQIGLVQQSAFSTRSPPLLVKGLVSLVSIVHLPRICDLISIFQISQPASVVCSGIGLLLLVSIIFDLSVSAIMTLAFHRLLKTQKQAKMYSSISLCASRVFSTVSCHTRKCDRLLR